MHPVFAPKVFQLGYVALEATDISKSKDHYAETIGMTETAVGHDGESYLSIGYEHHNIVLRKAEQKALAHLGFQLKPEIEIKDLLREAQEAGLTATTKSDSQPGIAELVEITAPGDVVHQFYHEIATPAPGFKGGVVSPLRLGHAAIISTEGAKLRKFYEDFLGFWFTDSIAGVANFLTCNREHHVVNVTMLPENRLHHIAFQLKGNAAHAVAADALRKDGVPIQWGPSRHSAGHNLASYHFDPDYLLIELYTDMDVFIPELGIMEARPWHEHFPMRPKDWTMDEMSAWRTEFAYDLGHGLPPVKC